MISKIFEFKNRMQEDGCSLRIRLSQAVNGTYLLINLIDLVVCSVLERHGCDALITEVGDRPVTLSVNQVDD